MIYSPLVSSMQPVLRGLPPRYAVLSVVSVVSVVCCIQYIQALCPQRSIFISYCTTLSQSNLAHQLYAPLHPSIHIIRHGERALETVESRGYEHRRCPVFLESLSHCIYQAHSCPTIAPLTINIGKRCLFRAWHIPSGTTLFLGSTAWATLP